MIRKKKNAGLQQIKAVNGLSKAGGAGLLITESDGNTIVSLFGNKERAMMSVHMAIAKTQWLNILATTATGPKITMKKEDIGEPIQGGDLEKADIEEDMKREEDLMFGQVSDKYRTSTDQVAIHDTIHEQPVIEAELTDAKALLAEIPKKEEENLLWGKELPE